GEARVPGKEDRDLSREAVAARRDAERLALGRAGHGGLLADSLRADHYGHRLQVDVREGSEQPGVEARGAFVALPAMARLHQLIDAVLGKRRDQPREVALLLGDRVPFPELANLVELGLVGSPANLLEHVHVPDSNSRWAPAASGPRASPLVHFPNLHLA